MTKQKKVVGDILKINLPNGKLGYLRVLDKAAVAVYDLMTEKVVDIAEIIKCNILFIVAVYDDVIVDGVWEKIGNSPLDEKLKELPMKFIQDELNPDYFELYNPNNHLFDLQKFLPPVTHVYH